MCAGHQLAVSRPVEGSAAGREPERPGQQGLLDEGTHLGDVGSGRRFVGRAPVAHHEAAQWAVTDLGADVDHPGHAFECVEVFGIALPLPRDSLGHRAAGNVFDSLHQGDQPVVPIGGGGGKADTAIAHHDGGDAVPTRRCHPRIPGGLGVVVGVNVDETGCHQAPGGVDLAVGERSAASRFDGRDPAFVHDHVAVAGGRASAIDDGAIADHQVMHRRRSSEDAAVYRGR